MNFHLSANIDFICDPLQASFGSSTSTPVKIRQSVKAIFFPIFVTSVSMPTNPSNLTTDKNSVVREMDIVLIGVTLKRLIVVEISIMVANAPP